MKRAVVICFLAAMLTTGCAGKGTEEAKEITAAEPAADVSEIPSMIVVEEEAVFTGESADVLTEAGAGAAMSEKSPGNDMTDITALQPEAADENPQEAQVSYNTAEAGPSEESSEVSSGETADDGAAEDSASAGIFTSSELSDDIKAKITGSSYPPGCGISYDDLRYLRLSYVDFNGQTQVGEMICNKAVASDLVQIFSELYHAGYQIDKMKLIDEYGADDDLSCADDNTSCFNYRVVAGSTNLSKHAMGVAVDLNPFYNPYVTYPNGKIRISPPGSEPYADRSSDFPHKIDENDLAYKLFTQHGFTWGGHWKTLKDYQHFQKPL